LNYLKFKEAPTLRYKTYVLYKTGISGLRALVGGAQEPLSAPALLRRKVEAELVRKLRPILTKKVEAKLLRKTE
jgi:hypothetical protein